MDTPTTVVTTVPTWIDVLNTGSQVALAALIPWVLVQWNKWRGVQQTAQEKRDQEQAVLTSVLSVQQEGIKALKAHQPVPPGPERLAEAVSRAKSLAPGPMGKLSDEEIELRVEANVAALALSQPISIRPPTISVRGSIYPPARE